MLDLKKYNEEDPLKRMVEKDSGGIEMSPMDSPDLTTMPSEPENLQQYHAGLKPLVS